MSIPFAFVRCVSFCTFLFLNVHAVFGFGFAISYSNEERQERHGANEERQERQERQEKHEDNNWKAQ